MARIPRTVVPGVPHHITQRGTRRATVFFSRVDYKSYLQLLGGASRRHQLDVWTYCLMPNHVHLIATPASESGLSRPLADVHRRHARTINKAHGWSGHLWQERFSSFPMDERHLRAAVRYVLLNPVRAGLVRKATDWPFSSARAQILGTTDPIVNTAPMSERVADWDSFLNSEDPEGVTALSEHSSSGYPLGSDAFIQRIERLTGRLQRRRKPGRRPKLRE